MEQFYLLDFDHMDVIQLKLYVYKNKLQIYQVNINRRLYFKNIHEYYKI